MPARKQKQPASGVTGRKRRQGGKGRPFPKGIHPATEWQKGQSGNPAGYSKAQARARQRMLAVLHGDFAPEDEAALLKAIKEHPLVMGPERVAINLIAKNAAQAAERIAGKIDDVVQLSGLGGGPIQVERTNAEPYDSPKQLLATIEALRDAGVLVDGGAKKGGGNGVDAEAHEVHSAQALAEAAGVSTPRRS